MKRKSRSATAKKNKFAPQQTAQPKKTTSQTSTRSAVILTGTAACLTTLLR